MAQSQFKCPIPWVSLSLGAQTTPRLCCHQSYELEPQKLTDLEKLFHVESIREQIKQGKIPLQCKGCFDLEAAGCFSPRLDYLNRFGETEEVAIKYLDVTFNNDCNLECVMCSPMYSYKLNKFFHQGLNFPKVDRWSINITDEKLHSLLPGLQMLTITGGEPFVSKQVLSFIKSVYQSGYSKNITLRLFTNLTRLDLDLLKILESFKNVEIYLSIDSVEENYEYIRYPAKWKKITENLELLKSHQFPHLEINLHCVLMNINWAHIPALLQFYFEKLEGFCSFPVFVEIENPSFLHPSVMRKEDLLKSGSDILKFLDEKEIRYPHYKERIVQMRNLITKISKRWEPQKLIEYKVFLSKLEKVRQG